MRHLRSKTTLFGPMFTSRKTDIKDTRPRMSIGEESLSFKPNRAQTQEGFKIQSFTTGNIGSKKFETFKNPNWQTR